MIEYNCFKVNLFQLGGGVLICPSGQMYVSDNDMSYENDIDVSDINRYVQQKCQINLTIVKPKED